MSKIYKANNKLAVYVPFDVIDALNLKDGDEIDFLRYGDNSFIMAKKNDIVKLLTKTNLEEQQPKAKVTQTTSSSALESNELELLKKLDTLRYQDRTGPKVSAILNNDEKVLLQALIKKGFISYRKSASNEMKYFIDKGIYDKYLWKNLPKKDGSRIQAQPIAAKRFEGPKMQQKTWERKITGGGEGYIEMLESKGFVVLSNEPDAALVSSALEDSIRHGLVVGTRAFNKKFYIGLRGFINKHASKILKTIEDKSMSASDIAESVGIEEDGVRTVLYVLAESGDVTEVRRDIFRSA